MLPFPCLLPDLIPPIKHQTWREEGAAGGSQRRPSILTYTSAASSGKDTKVQQGQKRNRQRIFGGARK